MYHLDKPGGPSRPRQIDISRQEWGEPNDALSSSRVEECQSRSSFIDPGESNSLDQQVQLMLLLRLRGEGHGCMM
jgi:hypothetical protein